MTELQAALGLSQVQRLGEFVAKRHILQQRYDDLLTGLPLVTPYQTPTSYSSLHLYPIQIELSQVIKSRELIFQELRESGVGVNVHYIPVHTQPYYQLMGFQCGDFPVAEAYYSRAITLPLFYEMDFEQQDKVIQVLGEVLQ